MKNTVRNEVEGFMPIFLESEKMSTETILNKNSSLSDYYSVWTMNVDLVNDWIIEMNRKGFKKSQIYRYLKNIESNNPWSEAGRNAYNLRISVMIYTRGKKLL